MGIMGEIRGALAGGATREQLEAAGYKRSSVYQAQRQLKAGAGAGDNPRRHGTAQRRANPGVLPVTPIAALPAPSDELIDKREVLQLRQLDNALLVEGQKTERLKPETPEPPNEISNARAMIGLFSDLKTLFPAPETPVSTPAAEGSKLSSVQLLNLDIARMESQERQLIRGEARELEQAQQQAELVKEVGGYLTKGLGTLVSAFREIKATEPARVRAPALKIQRPPALGGESPGKFPAMTRSADGQVWTRPMPDTDVGDSLATVAQPPDRPGGSWVASADVETGEVISWAWAADPPVESVRERLRRLRLNGGGVEVRPVVQAPERVDQKGRFFTGSKTYVGGS